VGAKKGNKKIKTRGFRVYIFFFFVDGNRRLKLQTTKMFAMFVYSQDDARECVCALACLLADI
jgi:hypothetical protein